MFKKNVTPYLTRILYIYTGSLRENYRHIFVNTLNPTIVNFNLIPAVTSQPKSIVSIIRKLN